MIDAGQVWCFCIKGAQDREGEVLSYLSRTWCADFADIILGESVEGKLANLTITDDRDKVVFDTQEATCCPGIVREAKSKNIAFSTSPRCRKGSNFPG